MSDSNPRTLLDKVWDAHVVAQGAQQRAILYIDLHLVHEVTSAQAFEGLRLANRPIRRAERTIATLDHNIPTTDRAILQPICRRHHITRIKQRGTPGKGFSRRRER